MRTATQRLIVAWSWISSLVLVGAVTAVLGFLFTKGLPAMNL